MEIIIKNPKFRPDFLSGRIRNDIRIPRYWRNKETKMLVEVLRYLMIPGKGFRVIYFDEFAGPDGHELSCSIDEFKKNFESVGNFR